MLSVNVNSVTIHEGSTCWAIRSVSSGKWSYWAASLYRAVQTTDGKRLKWVLMRRCPSRRSTNVCRRDAEVLLSTTLGEISWARHGYCVD